ncbi:MAG: hypothetical protein ACLUVG_04590 [Phocaeicola vulgatus]
MRPRRFGKSLTLSMLVTLL